MPSGGVIHGPHSMISRSDGSVTIGPDGTITATPGPGKPLEMVCTDGRTLDLHAGTDDEDSVALGRLYPSPDVPGKPDGWDTPFTWNAGWSLETPGKQPNYIVTCGHGWNSAGTPLYPELNESFGFGVSIERHYWDNSIGGYATEFHVVTPRGTGYQSDHALRVLTFRYDKDHNKAGGGFSLDELSFWDDQAPQTLLARISTGGGFVISLPTHVHNVLDCDGLSTSENILITSTTTDSGLTIDCTRPTILLRHGSNSTTIRHAGGSGENFYIGTSNGNVRYLIGPGALSANGVFFDLTSGNGFRFYGTSGVLKSQIDASGNLAIDGNATIGGGLTTAGPLVLPTLADTAASKGSLFWGADHGNALCVKDPSGAVSLVDITTP